MWETRAHVLELYSTVFPGSLERSWVEVEQLGLETVLIWNAGIAGGGLTHYATMPAPIKYIFKNKRCVVQGLEQILIGMMNIKS